MHFCTPLFVCTSASPFPRFLLVLTPPPLLSLFPLLLVFATAVGLCGVDARSAGGGGGCGSSSSGGGSDIRSQRLLYYYSRATAAAAPAVVANAVRAAVAGNCSSCPLTLSSRAFGFVRFPVSVVVFQVMD